MMATLKVESMTTATFDALSPSLKELEEFEERGRQICECEMQVQFWKEKLDTLMDEQLRYYRLARLRISAETAWSLLPAVEKQKKENILAAFQSDNIPPDLFRFTEADFPLHIRSDRDIFLARVRRKDFGYFDNLRYRIDDLIPPALHGDKEIMIECVQRNPRSVECLSNELKDDKDLFRAVLKATPLPPKFLLSFSEAVRSDADLLLELFNHPDVSPKNVKPKTQVMRYASQRLRDDYDFVLHCVQKSGLNLRYASADLRRNPTIVAAACAQCKDAISYCLPEAIDAGIFEHKAIAKSVVPQTGDFGLLLQCLEQYRYDPEVVTMAMKHTDFDWEEFIPEELRSNVDFIVKAIQLQPVLVWYTISDEMKSDLRVASEIFYHKKSAEVMIWEAIDFCPDVLFCRECVKGFLLNHSHLTSVFEYISGITDVDIWNNRELMIAAISQNHWNWDGCSEELRRDRSFMLEVAEKCPSVFVCIEDEYQMEHPEMVIRALQKHPDYLRERFDDFCPDLWENRNVAIAWLKIGGGWSRNFFPPEYRTDEEMVLLASRYHWEDFAVASENLLQEKTFLSKALAVNAHIIEYVGHEVIADEEILMAAISSDSDSIEYFVELFEDHGPLVSFAQRVRQRLRECWAFQQDFIPATALSSNERNECALPMLNQGPATLTTYIDNISSYLGILRQNEEIAAYIAASNNLAAWGL